MADAIQKRLQVKAEVVTGARGEFSVLVDDKVVAKKGLIFFPSEAKVIQAVRREIGTAAAHAS